MKWWIKFGCFLTGYNYRILNLCSEASTKSLKRYTSAMLIVCIIWSFIGFVFTSRYIKTGIFGSIVGSVILCTIVIQIERQIILASHDNRRLYWFRGVIALLMAVIGSIILDQIIFKEDIELGKTETLNAKVNKLLPDREKEARHQVAQFEETINNKESEKKKMMDDINHHPTLKSYASQSSEAPVVLTINTDTSNHKQQQVKIIHTNSVSISSIANPNIALLTPLNQQISELRAEKSKKEESLIQLRTDLQNEIKAKTGFLDELNVMFTLLTSSWVALGVWLLWLFLLVGLELFIMFSKMGDDENDYDLTIKHHSTLQKKKLALMASSATS